MSEETKARSVHGMKWGRRRAGDGWMMIENKAKKGSHFNHSRAKLNLPSFPFNPPEKLKEYLRYPFTCFRLSHEPKDLKLKRGIIADIW